MATKAKTPPIAITITGKKQAALINKAFSTKAKLKAAEKEAETGKASAIELLTDKVIERWKQDGRPEFGAYEFHLPDGTTHTIHVQNRYSTKRFAPKDAKTAIGELVKLGVKPDDVFDVVATTTINNAVFQIPAIKARIFDVLNQLELDLKREGLLPKDTAVIQTTKECVLQEHAVPKMVSACNTVENGTEKQEDAIKTALGVMNNPVTISLIK